MFLLFLLLVGGSLLLMRRGGFGPPPFVRSHPQSPEAEAKKVLAERFARGDISSDDFLERASILNWTPGNDTLPARAPGRRR